MRSEVIVQQRLQEFIFGHSKKFFQVSDALKLNKQHPVIMVKGLQGIGKRTFVDFLITYMLCKDHLKIKQDKNSDVLEIENSALDTSFNIIEHPDIFVLEKSENKNILMDEIESLKDFLSSSSIRSDKKYIIIDSANSLTPNSGSALLKALEDMGSKNIFFLINHADKEPILPTITSRSFVLNIKPLSDELIFKILERKGINYDKKLACIWGGKIGAGVKVNDDFMKAYKSIVNFLIDKESAPVVDLLDGDAYGLDFIFRRFLTVIRSRMLDLDVCITDDEEKMSLEFIKKKPSDILTYTICFNQITDVCKRMKEQKKQALLMLQIAKEIVDKI